MDDVGLLAQSLIPTSSLLVDIGHGSLSCNRFKGRRLQVDNWSGLLEIAAIVGDINPELGGNAYFSRQHVTSVRRGLEGKNLLEGVDTVFINGWHGISTLLDWHVQGQAVDTMEDREPIHNHFGTQSGQRSIQLLRQLFRAGKKGISVWLTVPLKPSTSPIHTNHLVPDIDQPEILQELLCISDLVVSQASIWVDGAVRTVLVTDPHNKWGLPAKSATAFGLAPLEPPDLSALSRKVLVQVSEGG
ncbi:MAG: hypothetical protein HQL55_12965 [Magnetococcales bacterium]|nr:hypothetical protein [Magnetococcales bacterium]